MRFPHRTFLLAITIILTKGCTGIFAPNYKLPEKQYKEVYTAKLSLEKAEEILKSNNGSPILDLKNPKRKNKKKPYFIEFRARSAVTYGHASVVIGKLTSQGKLPVDKNGLLNPKIVEITGLHPSDTLMPVGHIFPVPSSTTPTYGDHKDSTLTQRYGISLTKKEFQKVVAIVKIHKQHPPLWFGLSSNCVTYICKIAKDLGLKTPSGLRIRFPFSFVSELKRLNTPPSPKQN